MAVVINEFEAVGETPEARRQEGEASAPKKLEPALLATPLRRIAARERRVSAH
jgi:hypothetical protein